MSTHWMSHCSAAAPTLSLIMIVSSRGLHYFHIKNEGIVDDNHASQPKDVREKDSTVHYKLSVYE